MKRLSPLVLALILSFNSYTASAAERVDGYDAFIDALFMRPFGILGVVGGTAAFVAVSPLTALATIPAPHNAFDLMANSLIVRPARFTFVRKVGDYNFE